MSRKYLSVLLVFFMVSGIIFYINGITKAKGDELKGKNIYQKIQSGQKYQYIIVGDSIGRGSGARVPAQTWFAQWEKQIYNHYHASAVHYPIVQSGATAFEGIVKFQKEKPNKDIDLAFIVFGENDRKYMTAHQFSFYYEKLIRDIKTTYPKAEIVTITESCLQYPQFADTIKMLSEHYQSTNVDMREPFRMSGIPVKNLTRDMVHPNPDGYRLYANELFKVFTSKAASQKIIPKSLAAPMNSGTDISYNNVNKPVAIKDFYRRGAYYISSKKDARLEYDFYGNSVGVNVFRHIKGGRMNVYIDGKYSASISTWWPFGRERHLFIASNLGSSKHRIEFINTGAGTHLAAGSKPTVRISSIIVPSRIKH